MKTMSSIFQYILIAISAALTSSQISIDVQRCEERVITKCPCGPGGNLTDVYVDGCRVISNESLPCQPCPGSCNLFLNCEKCSKHECISCPLGKTGPNCEPMHSDNDSVTENNHTAIQNDPEELAPSTNSATAKVIEYGIDQPMPNIVVLDLSKIKNSSFQPAIDVNRPEIKLDVIEFKEGKTSIVKVVPDNAPHFLQNNSKASNETILDVGAAENNKDVLSNDETDFGNEIDVTYPQKNETITAHSEDRKSSGELLTFVEIFPIVNDSVNTFDGLQKKYSKDKENGLAMHRSPNPSAEEDKSKILRHVLKKNLNNELDQLELEQDLADAYQQAHPEILVIPSVQEAVNEIENRAQNNDSQPEEFDRKTTAETKYVYIGKNDENESKYPDSEYESPFPFEQEQASDENESKYPDSEYESSFPLEQEQMSDEKLYESEEIEAMKPDQQYDPSKPQQLKQYFAIKEKATLKPKVDPFEEDLRKILCKFFPNFTECQNGFDFRSQEVSPNPGSKLLFPNTENDAPSTDPATDIVEQNDDVYSEIQKNGFGHLKMNLLTYDPSNTIFDANTSPFAYIVRKYSDPLNANNVAEAFRKNRVNTLFDNFMDLVRSHTLTLFHNFLSLLKSQISTFEEDRSHSAENQAPRPQKVRQASKLDKNILKTLLPFNPAIANSRVGVIVGNDLQKPNRNISFMSLNFLRKNFFSTEHQKTPFVKGHLSIANIARENRTDPRIAPGSVRTQKFEFEIPIPSLFANSRESKNLVMKTEQPKRGKGFRLFRLLHNKRRRNGVKNDSTNSRRTKHAMVAARKNRSNRGYIRIRYVKDDSEPMYESSKPNPSNKNTFYSQVYEYDLQPQDMENFTAENEIASSESNSDSNGPFIRFRRDIEATPFCPIPRDSRNGDLDCTIWSYKKTCSLVCHNGYTSPSQHFTCQRSKNTWVPPMVSCKGGPEYEPLGGLQLRQLDDGNIDDNGDYDKEEPPPPRDDDNDKDYDDEKSSGEMGDQGQDGGDGEEEAGRRGKAHAHKKKAHLNSVKDQDEVEDARRARKAPTKRPELVRKPVAENEEEWKEEPAEDAPKAGSAEEQSEEESYKEEVNEAPKDQEVEQNDVDSEYDGYERKK